MKNYPTYTIDPQSPRYKQETEDLLRFILKERINDVNDFANLQNRFISGRKVGKIPTGAADVSPSDRIGDVSYDDAYLYILIDDSGTAEWRRTALSSW